MTKRTIVALERLSFAYHQHIVLDNIHLTVKEGDFLAILGPNGGGKTTLLKIILGLLTNYHGHVEVFGHAPSHVMGKIGFVPQLGVIQPQLPITVKETILMGLKRRLSCFKYSKADDEKAWHVMKITDISMLAEKPMAELSGGQRQRVFLARALISDPELLVLDEPTSNIDPYGTACFFDVLHELASKKTILVVTHDLGITAANVSCIACLNKTMLYHEKPTLTDEMLPFLYGTAHPNCSAAHPLNQLADSLNRQKGDAYAG